MFKPIASFSSFSAGNISQAKIFYATVLGLQVTERPEGLELIQNGNQVFVYPKSNHVPATFTVLNFIVEDIDAAVDDLIEKGVQMEQYAEMHTDPKGICRNDGRHPGPKAIAWFKDPDGNFLSVLQEK